MTEFGLTCGFLICGGLTLLNLLQMYRSYRVSNRDRQISTANGTPNRPEAVEFPALQASEQNEVRLVRDMLQLRILADEDFSSPQELLQEFLRKLALLSGFSQATLFQKQSPGASRLELLSSGGCSLPPDLMSRWRTAEQATLTSCPEITPSGIWLKAQDFSRITGCEGAPLRSALIFPLSGKQSANGVLILSSEADVPAHPVISELARWVAEFLPHAFEKALNRHQLEERARRDGLTRLANRHVFEQELERQWQISRSLQSPCTLLLIDADHFKRINDRCGHLAGDAVLVCLAQIISDTVQQQRITDRPLVSRFGGEEFAVVLPECSLIGGMRIAEQIRARVQNQPMLADGHQLNDVTVSIGVATTEESDLDPAHLVRRADHALYAAKESGRNCVIRAEQKRPAASGRLQFSESKRRFAFFKSAASPSPERTGRAGSDGLSDVSLESR